ncbi:MAG: chorismate dehydratase [Leptospiraceae bacterium]|nr:MAG: chorismate dehydratase [Leptospiraceae bacterium]
MQDNSLKKEILRIGTVKFLNAKPLDYGFFYPEGNILNHYKFKIYEDVPSILIKYLKEKQIDIGLISSIEALRNENQINFYPHLGICSQKNVQSIFYITKKNYKKPVKRIYLDQSSRSSNELLKILYYFYFKELPEFIIEKPQNILNKINDNSAGLIIGDPAINLYLNPNSFYLKDLAEWWYELTQLPFVFAVWAFPKELNINLKIFEESYRIGKKSIDKIIIRYSFPRDFSYQYLTKNLYYEMGEKELKSLQLYKSFLMELDLF